MKPSSQKDYVWNTIGVLLQNALSPLLLIVVTRMNGINDSGIFSFAFSIAIIFWAIGMWGGRTYQVSDSKHIFNQQSYVVLRILLSFVMLIGAIVFSLLNNYDITKINTILVLVIFKMFESVADSIYGVMQINDRLYISGISLTYKAIVGFGVFVSLNLLTHDVVLSSFGLVVVNVLLIIFYDVPRVKRIYSLNVAHGMLKIYLLEALKIMRKCFAVFMVSFLAAFSLNIPRYFVDQYHESQIGYFGIIAMPVTLVVLLMTFILQPNIVNLSRQLHQKNYKYFNKTINIIILITVSIGLFVLGVTYLIGVQLLTIVFGVDFSNYKTPLIIITLGAVASALVAVFINMLTIMRRLKVQVYILLLTNIVLALVCLFAVKTYGLAGGVILFTVMNVTQAILFGIVYKSYVRRLQDVENA